MHNREAELRRELAALSQRVQRLEEHNRLLTLAATERARKLQEHEAELMQELAAMSQRVERLEEHNRLLTLAAAERARKLQDREAELTGALSVMSRRVERLSAHNRWLTENAPESESQPHQLRAFRPDALDGMAVPSRHMHEQQARFLPRSKHVLMVTPVLALGGSERQMLATADGLINRGYQVEVFCFAAPPDDPNFGAELARLGVKCSHGFERADSVHSDDARDVQGLQGFARLVDHADVVAIGSALGRAIKDFRPEIVHCWSDFASAIGGLVATNLGVPGVVLGQRNVPAFRNIDGPEPYVCRDAYRLLARRANVIMLNNSLAGLIAYARWLDVPNDRIKVLYNGFMPSAFRIRGRTETEECRRQLGLPGNRPVVGTVMRFATEKDPILWLDTAAAIAAARPDSCFLLAGYGELEERIRHTIESLGLADRFVLLGAIEDVGLIYAALDVFLMTSRFEGSPNVLIEAQAAGMPVVAPNVGGVCETVLDGTTGIVVVDRRPSSLATAVLQILDDPSWPERAAIHGPVFASHRFGHQRMIDETIAVYDAAVDQNLPETP